MSLDEFDGIDEWIGDEPGPEQKRDWPAWTPVWHDLIFGGVSSRGVHLYAVLARFSGQKGAWPRRRVLADAVGCSLDSLDRAKDELIEAGWMTVEWRYRESGDGGRTSNLYRLHQVSKSAVPRPQKQGMPQPQIRGTKNDTQSRTTEPPTPSDVAAEPGTPTRTYQGTPLPDVPRVEPTASGRAQLKNIKDKIRPPREETG